MTIKVKLIFIGVLCSFAITMAQNTGNGSNRALKSFSVANIYSQIDLASLYLGQHIPIETQSVKTASLKIDSIHPVSSLVPFPIDLVEEILIVNMDNVVIKEFVDRSGETKTYKRPLSV